MEDYDPNKIYKLKHIYGTRLTPLQYAIWKKLPINRILAQAPKNELHTIVNQPNDIGSITPLMVAAMFGRNKGIATVHLLLDLGAEVNKQANNGFTALIFAALCIRTTSSEKVVKLLLEAGANPNIQDDNNVTALMYAVQASSTDSTDNTENTEKTVEILLQPQYSTDPNLQNNAGYTALMFAVSNSRAENLEKTVELLLQPQYGVNPNLQSDIGHTALMYAARFSKTGSTEKTVQLLLQYKVGINIRDKDGLTALMYACKGVLEGTSTENTIKLLINYGATYTKKDLKNCIVGQKYSVRANSAATSLQQHYKKRYYSPSHYKNTTLYKSMQERYDQI